MPTHGMRPENVGQVYTPRMPERTKAPPKPMEPIERIKREELGHAMEAFQAAVNKWGSGPVMSYREKEGVVVWFILLDDRLPEASEWCARNTGWVIDAGLGHFALEWRRRA